uniref:Uncharacterized protein n=1 Tax=Sphaerodactylus townsendi TaxID=933632 RepID=A0ACB8FSZ6_9SAUR
MLNPFNVVILFQPVTLQCNYQTTYTQPPVVTWKYKSYCRSRLTDAFSPNTQDSQINNQLQQSNPGYNPYVECQDSVRTVRVVASKQGNSVTLGDFYQGRRITITNDVADGLKPLEARCGSDINQSLIKLEWLFVVNLTPKYDV